MGCGTESLETLGIPPSKVHAQGSMKGPFCDKLVKVTTPPTGMINGEPEKSAMGFTGLTTTVMHPVQFSVLVSVAF